MITAGRAFWMQRTRKFSRRAAAERVAVRSIERGKGL